MVRRERRWTSAGATPARELVSLHPVAIEAAAEATKLSELSMYRVARRLGEGAGHNLIEHRAGPEKVVAGADLAVTQGRPQTMEIDERTSFIGPAAWRARSRLSAGRASRERKNRRR
jgi:hypothetical protein